jgi:hypothetical protein
MLPPESVMISCPSANQIVSAYNEALAKLSPEARRQLATVMKKYVVGYDLESIYERFNGRTAAQVLAEYREPPARPIACSGERDGVRFSLYEARRADERDSEGDKGLPK